MTNIVVYRNHFEANADQFYSENPEYIMYILGGCIIVGVGLYLWNKYKKTT